MTDNMSDKKITYYSLSGNTEEDKKLLEPVKYISQCELNNLSKNCTNIFNYWLQVSPENLQQIDEILSILFKSCLLLDDIQDKATYRGDFPVANSIYGIGNTINAANYAQMNALEKMGTIHPEAIKITIEGLQEFYRGQGLDMYWKENYICPTEEEYKMVARKCGWFPRLAYKLMKLFSLYEEDLSPLINNIALYYQINDDYCNLCEETDDDHNYCSDLSEGKFSFPVIHAITRNPEDKQILNILKQRTTDRKMKRYCVNLLESFGSLKYTKDVFKKLKKEMEIEIERLGGHPLFLSFLALKNCKSTIP
ncbi:geranylgeranyl pyrophosphate synthase [Solenopsis invicta]|uniref:geranylgeranyl pyrophosphate synthase n=1 Tax=Solenopsis invicta TaxID=13686 RepID=UPI000E33F03E|nr:geranylgeranyl pyrophosphate synthase [Solenopsis invicta]XP_039312736.1 geranylgeranyl pyrophosphate synthase [Solenopsis invicta]